MSALTLRLPDDKHDRLRALVKSRGATVNRLMDEVATVLVSEFDAETRFRLRAARGASVVSHKFMELFCGIRVNRVPCVHDEAADAWKTQGGTGAEPSRA